MRRTNLIAGIFLKLGNFLIHSPFARPAFGQDLRDIAADSYDRDSVRSELAELSVVDKAEEAFSVYRQRNLIPAGDIKGDEAYVQFLMSSDRDLNIPGHKFLVDLASDINLNFVTNGYENTCELIYLALLDSSSRLNPVQLKRYHDLLKDKLTTQLTTYNGALEKSPEIKDTPRDFINRFRIIFREKVKQSSENQNSKSGIQLLSNKGKQDLNSFVNGTRIKRRQFIRTGAGLVVTATLLAFPSLIDEDNKIPTGGFLKPEYDFSLAKTPLDQVTAPNKAVSAEDIQEVAGLIFERAKKELEMTDKDADLKYVEVIKSSTQISHFNGEGKLLEPNYILCLKNKEGGYYLSIPSSHFQYYKERGQLSEELNFRF